MITNISYNVIIERFRAFAEGHFLIKGFTHGDPSNVDLLKGVEFPWMHVFPVEVAPQQGSRLYSFIITFADLPRDKETPPEYQREMLSDCIRLAEDLLAEIKNGLTLFGPTVELDGASSIECFINEFSHTLTGVNLSLTLMVPWDWNACDVPGQWAVGGSGSGGIGGGGLGIILETNGVLNGEQGLLNLQQGANVTIVDNGLGTVTISAGVSSIAWGDILGTLSDQTDLQNALDAKANTVDLGPTAFSNDYNDLDNLPTIPAAQIQSDWNQSNSSALDFIKNKPAIGTGSVTSVAIQLPSPVNQAYSVTGSPITSSGTFTISANGTSLQYIDGTGALRTFPAIPKTLTDIIGSGTKVGDLIQWNGTAWAIINGLSLDALNNVNAPSPTNGQVLAYDTASAQWIPITPATGGSVTSVGLSLPAPVNPAFSVSGSPVTTSGTITISANGTSSQYVDGTGALQTMPTGLPPTGTAGGDLSGTYPNPNVDRVHGIDFQSGTPSVGDVWLYEGTPAKWQHQQLPAIHVGNDSAVTGSTVKDALNHLNTTKVESNAAITGATATKITYDSKGLVTAGTTLAASDIPSGIDAAKIGTGIVSNTEFGYLDGVTSAIQTQIDGKQSTLVSGTNIKTINSNSLLGSGNVSVGTVTSVGGTGTVAGLSLSGTVTGSGNLTLGGTLSTPVNTINDSTTVGQNLVKLANPNAIRYLRINADNSVSAISLATLKSELGMPAFTFKTTNDSTTATAFADVPELSFAVTAGTTYNFKFRCNFNAALQTTGSRWAINGPASPTRLMYMAIFPASSGGAIANAAVTTYDSVAVSAASVATTQNFAIVEGIIQPSANGTVSLRFASEVAGSAITCLANSYLELTTI